jgi:hypothetical protein
MSPLSRDFTATYPTGKTEGKWLLRLDSEPLAASRKRAAALPDDSLGCHFRGTRKWLLRLDSKQQPSG